MARDYYDQIQKGKIYAISNTNIKNSTKFNPTNNPLELLVNNKTIIE